MDIMVQAILIMSHMMEKCGNSISISRCLSKAGSKFSSSVTISPSTYDIETIIGNLELPIFNFSEFLALSANKQKDLMMSILPDVGQAISTANFFKSIKSYSLDMEECIKELVDEQPILENIEDVKKLNSRIKSITEK